MVKGKDAFSWERYIRGVAAVPLFKNRHCKHLYDKHAPFATLSGTHIHARTLHMRPRTKVCILNHKYHHTLSYAAAALLLADSNTPPLNRGKGG